jgi:8-oxo-dGTP diphosphatase
MENSPTLLFVVAAALTNDKGEILLQQRPIGAQMGGLWEFPGGKVHLGESPEAALVRELEEELGIIVAVQDLVPETFASEPLGDRNLVLLLYRCVKWTGTPTALYASDIRWALPQDMADLLMPPADYPLVRKLQGI